LLFSLPLHLGFRLGLRLRFLLGFKLRLKFRLKALVVVVNLIVKVGLWLRPVRRVIGMVVILITVPLTGVEVSIFGVPPRRALRALVIVVLRLTALHSAVTDVVMW
jgi:hypothetical protein